MERLLRLADEACVAGRMEEAEEHFAGALVAAGGDERWLARVEVARGYARQVSTRDGVGSFPAIAERAIPVLERHGDRAGVAAAWKALARAHTAAGRAAAAEQACAKALDACARGGLPPDPYVLYLRGNALVSGPAPVADAVAYAEERIERGDAHPSSPLVVLAECAAMTGDFDRARELAARYRRTFDDSGRVPPALQAEIELLAGDAPAAERIAREVYETQLRLGDIGHGAGSAAVLARALLELGRTDEAAALADTIARDAPPDDRSAQIAWRTIAARARGDAGLAREALALADETEWTNVRARARLDLAALVVDGRGLVEEARALFEGKGNRVEAARAAARSD